MERTDIVMEGLFMQMNTQDDIGFKDLMLVVGGLNGLEVLFEKYAWVLIRLQVLNGLLRWELEK